MTNEECQERLSVLQSKLTVSEMGGLGLIKRIAAIKQAIADLQALKAEVITTDG